MKRILVSGCYDILHAGHIQFFYMVKDEFPDSELVVCVATDRVIRELKGREPAIPFGHRMEVIKSLRPVDAVTFGDDDPPHLNFRSRLKAIGVDMLVSTIDDRNTTQKIDICKSLGIEFHQLQKDPPRAGPISTTTARRRAALPSHVPLRVDFAGGWLDVPKFSDPKGYIVNCAITPTVSMDHWPYHIRAGLGGSAARSLLMGDDPVDSELEIAGWQDAAIIQQTGLCVWQSGKKPKLIMQANADWLNGKLALLWTGKEHDTKGLLDRERDYRKIAIASTWGLKGVRSSRTDCLQEAMALSYEQQIEEGMEQIVPGEFEQLSAYKYAGSGHGGYVVFLFGNCINRNRFVDEVEDAIAVEPYSKW